MMRTWWNYSNTASWGIICYIYIFSKAFIPANATDVVCQDSSINDFMQYVFIIVILRDLIMSPMRNFTKLLTLKQVVGWIIRIVYICRPVFRFRRYDNGSSSLHPDLKMHFFSLNLSALIDAIYTIYDERTAFIFRRFYFCSCSCSTQKTDEINGLLSEMVIVRSPYS